MSRESWGVRQLEKPTLNPSVVPVSVDDDVVHVRAGPWTGPVLTLRASDDGEVERLFGLLDGTNDLDSILDAFDPDDREAVLSVLEKMRRRNLVYDGAAVDGERGLPQLLLSPGFEEDERARLGDREALVVSAGDVGRQIASDLLDAGVGTIRFAQPLPEAAVDAPGLDASDRVRRVESGDLTDAVERADALVYAADREYPALGEEVNRTAHAADTPWLLAQVRGLDGLVGPTVFPGETGCLHCLERRIESGVDADRYGGFRRALDAAPDATPTGLACYDRLVAGYAAVDFLHLLAFGRSFTAGRAVTVSFADLSVSVEDVLRLPRCPVCGRSRGEDRARFVGVEDLADAVDAGDGTVDAGDGRE